PHAELPGMFCVRARHERGGFFVTNLNESNFVCAFAKRFHDPVDPIPWQPEYNINAPVVNSVNQHVRRRGFHARVLLHGWTSRVTICHVNSIPSYKLGRMELKMRGIFIGILTIAVASTSFAQTKRAMTLDDLLRSVRVGARDLSPDRIQLPVH